MSYIKKWTNTSIKEIVSWNYLKECKVRHIPKTLTYEVDCCLNYSWCGVRICVLELKHIIQCVEFLYDLQIHNLCHGDINPDNIVLYNDKITFIDFETLSVNGSSHNKTSPYFLLNYKGTSFMNDRFALWVSLCCMISREYNLNITRYNPKIIRERKIIRNTVNKLRPDLALILNQIYYGVPYEQILDVEHRLCNRTIVYDNDIIMMKISYSELIDDLLLCVKLLKNLYVKNKGGALRLINCGGISMVRYMM